MSARTKLRDDFDAGVVRGLAKASKDAAQTRRLLTVAAIYDGVSHLEAARMGGVTRPGQGQAAASATSERMTSIWPIS